VVANLSRHAQQVELDLRRFDGARPIELFGYTPFAPVGQRSYTMSLGPHVFHWFLLETTPRTPPQGTPPVLAARGDLSVALRGGALRRQLTSALTRYVMKQRWFAGKARRVQDVEIVDVVPIEQRG